MEHKNNRKKEDKESQVEWPESIFNKIIEEKIPNLKNEMSINIQEAYKTTIDWTRKENPPHKIKGTKKTIKSCK
jgi:hypothetical protein